MAVVATERLLTKILLRPDSGCWEWQAFRDQDGYGTFWLNGENRRAHRASYELFVGPIPDAATLDHLCRNRSCVNPEHLEPVSIGENLMRSPVAPASVNASKTHCARAGHPLSGANLYICPRGKRECRACRRETTARSRARKMEAA
jgi:hypothetical protein